MWKIAAGTAAAAVVCLARSEYERKALAVETVEITSEKIKSSRRFVFLSDLHSNEFGRDNEKLLAAIDSCRPDAVLSGGDMMVSRNGEADTEVALSLFKQLSGKYPVYCGNGNHENRMNWNRELYGHKYEDYRHELLKLGIIFLENASAWLGTDIRITGIDLGSRFYKKALLHRPPEMTRAYIEKKVEPVPEGSFFQILLAHSPLYFESYADWGADLSLSGHFHGGTIRLPLLGGVMTPQYQFFLPCCAGTFQKEGHWMAVSRGLGTHSINIRLNNRPQLLVIDLKPEKGEAHGNHHL